MQEWFGGAVSFRLRLLSLVWVVTASRRTCAAQNE